jgi:predicted DNA binding protein
MVGPVKKVEHRDVSMRCLRVRLSGESETLHPLLPHITDERLFREVLMLDWSFSAEPPSTTVLLYLDGDVHAFEEILATADVVHDYDVTFLGQERGYAFVHSRSPPVESEVLSIGSRDGLLPISPVRYHRDGSFTFRVLGTLDTLRAAVEALLESVEAHIEKIGGHELGRSPLPPEFPARQWEALTVAFEAGYYDVPRTATRDDVAERLDCAPSTATEHLQKAERRLVEWCLGR